MSASDPNGAGSPGDAAQAPLGLGSAHAPERPLGNGAVSERVDPRRYRTMIGALALLLLVAFTVYRFVNPPLGTIGIPAGVRLRWFAAPLATSTLVGDANVNPPCTSDRHDPRALNDCLDAVRGPLVLAFFDAGSATCVREIDTLQATAVAFGTSGVQFAAVAVRTGPARAAQLVRSHHWTIPVAYDRDGAVGALYGAAVCPLVELARRGGVVSARLIGDRWLSRGALTAQVSQLLSR